MDNSHTRFRIPSTPIRKRDNILTGQEQSQIPYTNSIQEWQIFRLFTSLAGLKPETALGAGLMLWLLKTALRAHGKILERGNGKRVINLSGFFEVSAFLDGYLTPRALDSLGISP